MGASTKLLTEQQFRKKLGGRSRMSLWRYHKRLGDQFPNIVKLCNRNYYYAHEVEAFLASLPRGKAAPVARKAA